MAPDECQNNVQAWRDIVLPPQYYNGFLLYQLDPPSNVPHEMNKPQRGEQKYKSGKSIEINEQRANNETNNNSMANITSLYL